VAPVARREPRERVGARAQRVLSTRTAQVGWAQNTGLVVNQAAGEEAVAADAAIMSKIAAPLLFIHDEGSVIVR